MYQYGSQVFLVYLFFWYLCSEHCSRLLYCKRWSIYSHSFSNTEFYLI